MLVLAATTCASDEPAPVNRTRSALLADASWTFDGSVSWFGRSVAGAGDVDGDGYADVVVGAPLAFSRGRAYLFVGSAGGLQDAPAWTFDSAQDDEELGWSVSGAGDVDGDGFDDVLVGAPRYGGGEQDEGRVLLFRGSADGLGADPDWSFEPDRAASRVGETVSSAGDVDGDGYDDVIVGATGLGRVYVFLGSAGGLGAVPDWTVDADEAGAFVGSSVAGAGDVDGDGYDDVILSSEEDGRASLYRGSPDGLEDMSAWTTESPQAFQEFHQPVAGVGDVNDDGFDDVLVGEAWLHWVEGESGHFAHAFYGSANGLSADPDWTIEGEYNGFGQHLSGAGDVNADGFDDVIVGAPMGFGAVVVYYGSAVGLAREASWTVEGVLDAQGLGTSVGGAGDVDADGFDDVIVGANWLDGVLRASYANLYQGTCDDGTPCPGGLCHDAACDADRCFLDGTWYADGDPDPTTTCRSCVAASSQQAWTSAAEGVACDDGDPGTSGDACQAGACVGTPGSDGDADTDGDTDADADADADADSDADADADGDTDADADADSDADADADGDGDDDGGCGCRSAGRSGRGPTPWLVPLLGVLLRARRRRRET